MDVKSLKEAWRGIVQYRGLLFVGHIHNATQNPHRLANSSATVPCPFRYK